MGDQSAFEVGGKPAFPEAKRQKSVSTAELMSWLALSREGVRQLEERGIISRLGRGEWDLQDCTARYLTHLRGIAAGRRDEGGTLDLAAERALLARAQREHQAMRNAVLRGELLPRAEVTAAVRTAFGHCRARLLALPSKVAPRIVGLGAAAEVQEVIKGFVYEALAELAETAVLDGSSDGDGPTDHGSGTGLVEDLDAAAGIDGR